MYALTRRASNGNFDFGQRGAFQHKFSLRGLRKIGPIPASLRMESGMKRAGAGSLVCSESLSLLRGIYSLRAGCLNRRRLRQFGKERRGFGQRLACLHTGIFPALPADIALEAQVLVQLLRGEGQVGTEENAQTTEYLEHDIDRRAR